MDVFLSLLIKVAREVEGERVKREPLPLGSLKKTESMGYFLAINYNFKLERASASTYINY